MLRRDADDDFKPSVDTREQVCGPTMVCAMSGFAGERGLSPEDVFVHLRYNTSSAAVIDVVA